MSRFSDLPPCTNAVHTAYERRLNDVSHEVEVEVEVEGEIEREVEGEGATPFESHSNGSAPTPGAAKKATVRTRTGKPLNNEPAQSFWNDAETVSQLNRLRASGCSEDDSRLLVVTQARASGRL